MADTARLVLEGIQEEPEYRPRKEQSPWDAGGFQSQAFFWERWATTHSLLGAEVWSVPAQDTTVEFGFLNGIDVWSWAPEFGWRLSRIAVGNPLITLQIAKP